MAAPTQPTTNGDRGTWGPLMTAWMDWVEGSLGGTESIDQLGIGTDSPDSVVEIESGDPVLLHLHEADSGGGLIQYTNTTDTDGWYAGISGTEGYAISRQVDPDLGNVIYLGQDGGVHLGGIKSGTDQGNAGAAAGELYQDTNDDNTIKIGV